jgi:uncharacterized Zn finger protein (UPF0148 family)
MNNKQMACDGCGFYFAEIHLHKRKDGKIYCGGCRVKIAKVPLDTRPVSKRDIDKIIEALLKVPPPPKKSKKTKSSQGEVKKVVKRLPKN